MKRATMVTSLRSPVWVLGVPNSVACFVVSTNFRLSEPTSRMLKGWPGGAWGTRCWASTFLIWSKR